MTGIRHAGQSFLRYPERSPWVRVQAAAESPDQIRMLCISPGRGAIMDRHQ
jgi:hypothetical protein